MQVSVLGVQKEFLARLSLDRFSNSVDSPCKPLKDSLDITSLLHGDNSELIFLIDPDQEGLGSIVEDTTALGPFPLHTSGDQVFVTGHEKEMVINKLLADILLNGFEWRYK